MVTALDVEGSVHWVYKLQSQWAVVLRHHGECQISAMGAVEKLKLCDICLRMIDDL